jgi:hypothetical protein
MREGTVKTYRLVHSSLFGKVCRYVDRTFPLREPLAVAKRRRREPTVVHVQGDAPADLEEPVFIDYDGFTFVVRFREVEGRLEIWSVEVNTVPWPGRKPRRITSTNLRFPWGRIIRKAAEVHLMRTHAVATRALDEADADELNPFRREAREVGFRIPPTPVRSPAERRAIQTARGKLPAAAEAFHESRRGRPQVWDPRVVADIYRTNLLPGLHPTKAVADKLGISATAAGKQVARARREGFLEPAPRPGVAGLAEPKRPKVKPRRSKGR